MTMTNNVFQKPLEFSSKETLKKSRETGQISTSLMGDSDRKSKDQNADKNACDKDDVQDAYKGNEDSRI